MDKNVVNITVIIPTYNRFIMVKDILSRQLMAYNGINMQFCIYDSSESDECYRYYQEFVKRHPLDFLQYIYCPEINSLSVKVKIAIEEVRTKYFYLIGDSMDVDYNALETELNSIQIDYDVLNINSIHGHYGKVNRLECGSLEINRSSNKEFVIDRMSLMTLYGASITKTDFFKKTFDNGIYDKFLALNSWQNGYVYVSSLCEAILTSKDKLILINYNSNCLKGNTLSKPQGSKWNQGTSLFEVGFKRFIDSVNGIYSLSETEKEKIIYRYYRVDWNSFGLWNLVELRANDTINKNNLVKYEPYLKKAGLYGRFNISKLVPVLVCRFFLYGKKSVGKIWRKIRI